MEEDDLVSLIDYIQAVMNETQVEALPACLQKGYGGGVKKRKTETN